jgi:hypothetical protein
VPEAILQQLAANAAAVDGTWQQARSLALVATSAEMRSHYEKRAARANERFTQGQRQLAREAELLARMEKALEPGWKVIVEECADLARESDNRRAAAIGQLIDLGRSAVTWGLAGPYAEKYLSAADQKMIETFAAANDAFYAGFTTGVRTGHTYAESRPADTAIETGSGIIELGAAVATSMGKKGAPYITAGNHVFQLGLQAFIYRNVSQRLKETEALAARLEAGGAPWRARVEAARKNLSQMDRRRNLAERQLAGQKALSERVERLLREAEP